jgi:hypothetical protein
MGHGHPMSRERRTAALVSRPFRGKDGKVRYRRVSPVPVRPREGPLTEPTPAVRPCTREQVFLYPKPTSKREKKRCGRF